MTRDEALLAGSPRYDGKPCRYGHGTEKFVSCYACVICRQDRQRRDRGTKNPTGPRGQTAKLKEQPPRFLIDIDTQRHSRQGTRLATAWVDDRPLFAMVVKDHSAEQVAAKLVALGYDNGPTILRYGDVLGTCPSLYRLAGVRI